MEPVLTFEDFRQAHGHSLAALGLNESAFCRSDAFYALDLATKEGRPILGGDVYYLGSDDRVTPAYANWHTDRQKDEEPAAYANRTWQTTREYLERFPENAGTCPIFVFVLAPPVAKG